MKVGESIPMLDKVDLKRIKGVCHNDKEVNTPE